MFSIIIADVKRYFKPRKYFSNRFSFYLQVLFIIFFQEGFRAILLHRIAYFLNVNRIKGFDLLVAKFGLFVNGIFINPSVKIGNGCKFNHGFTTVRAFSIGENVEITSNVTIGEKGAYSGTYPKIGDNVYLGAGSRIFANIGDNVSVGANSVVVNDIESCCVVAGIPAKVLRKNNS